MNTTEPEPIDSGATWQQLIRMEFNDKLFAKDDDLTNWDTELRMRMSNLTRVDICDAIRWASDTNWKCKEMTLKMLRTIIYCHRKHKVEESELTHGGEECPWCNHGWIEYTDRKDHVWPIPCLCPAGVHVESIAFKGQPQGQFKVHAKIALKQVQQHELEAREWAAKHPHVSTGKLLSTVATPFS